MSLLDEPGHSSQDKDKNLRPLHLLFDDQPSTSNALNLVQEDGTKKVVGEEAVEDGHGEAEEPQDDEESEDEEGMYVSSQSQNDTRPPYLLDEPQSSASADANILEANDQVEEEIDIINDAEGDFKISSSQKGKPKVFYKGHG